MIKTALLLAGCALMGCAHSNSHTSNPVEVEAKAHGVRVILTFSKTFIADNNALVADKALAEVISEACYCRAVFIRNYSDSALIYQIKLPNDLSFSAFEKRVLEKGSPWQIESVERDVRMKHQ